MLTTSIDELLLEFIFIKSPLTREDIAILKQKLYNLLGPRIDNKKELDELVICLINIVIRHRKQLRLPDSVNRLVSKYLPIPDAQKYLKGMYLTKSQIQMQLKERKLQIQQRFKKFLHQGKYHDWYDLIRTEYIKRKSSFDELIPYMTAQNLSTVEEEKSTFLWSSLITSEYLRGRSFDELILFITAKNMPNDEIRSQLWMNLITLEYGKGRSFKELVTFMTTQNMPVQNVRHDLWYNLIKKELERGKPYKEFYPFITEQNMPIFHRLNFIFPSSPWASFVVRRI